MQCGNAEKGYNLLPSKKALFQTLIYAVEIRDTENHTNRQVNDRWWTCDLTVCTSDTYHGYMNCVLHICKSYPRILYKTDPCAKIVTKSH